VEHQVGRVVSSVDQLTAATGGSGRPPAHVLRVEVVVEAVGGANLIDSAENALIQKLFCLGHRGQKKLIVSAHQGHTCCIDCQPHSICLLHGQAERLLAQDVSSCRSSGDDRLCVKVVRQADVHSVKICIEDHLAKIGVPDRTKLGCAPARGLVDHIGHRGHRDRLGEGLVAPDMSVRDSAAANQSNLDHVASIG
jgi:hypothetical protein